MKLSVIALFLARAAALEVSNTTTNACTGKSAGLAAADCSAWQDLYDGAGGRSWKYCQENRLDPCEGCGYEEAPVQCNRDGTHIFHIILNNNNLHGTIPASLSKMTELYTLDFDTNNLTGVVPPLPFAQYAGICCLENKRSYNTNHFTCPLPPGASTCNGDATGICAMSCTPSPAP